MLSHSFGVPFFNKNGYLIPSMIHVGWRVLLWNCDVGASHGQRALCRFARGRHYRFVFLYRRLQMYFYAPFIYTFPVCWKGGIAGNALRPEVPKGCELWWRSLMEQCWSNEPSDRPAFTEIAKRLRTIASSPVMPWHKVERSVELKIVKTWLSKHLPQCYMLMCTVIVTPSEYERVCTAAVWMCQCNVD
jgi:hypothetical protein